MMSIRETLLHPAEPAAPCAQWSPCGARFRAALSRHHASSLLTRLRYTSPSNTEASSPMNSRLGPNTPASPFRENGTQAGVKVACWQKPRQSLKYGWHAVDVKHEAREQQCGQKAGEQSLAATSCPRRVTEISKPCPSALSMNTDDNNTSTHREPRKGTAKSVTAATAHKAILNMPMQKYGISLPSSSCMRLTGVAKRGLHNARSPRANTREVSSVPIRVMMTVMARLKLHAPGSRIIPEARLNIDGQRNTAPSGKAVRCQATISPWL